MAKGAQVSAKSTSVANSGYLTYQPGTSVEAVIKNVCLAGENSTYVKLYDGSTYFDVLNGSDAKTLNGQVSITVSNSVYISLGNESGGAIAMALAGIQTV